MIDARPLSTAPPKPHEFMDATRWKQVQTLFEAALDHPPAERPSFLADACLDDEALLREVASLLAADENAHPLLDTSAVAAWQLPDDAFPPGVLRSEGERVGPYRIVRSIGQGGMGTVFLAERADGLFEQQVALKLVRGGMLSGRVVRRFEVERQILARLQHPNIARLLDGGVTAEGQPFFAMEYVDGIPLDRHCAAEDSDVRKRVALLQTVGEAVQYAHRSLIVHRDLKPSNVLVTSGGTVKLLDFGIAKMLADAEDASTAITQTGQQVMTPAYAAPEQLAGDPVTTATDVYALGVMLYELLAGERPHADDRIEAVRGGTPPAPDAPSSRAPTTRHRHIHGDLDLICLKALRPEPERRYDSAGQLADDLRRYLDGRPIEARPDTTGYRIRTFVRRHRTATLAAAAVAMLIVALVAFYTVRLAEERDRARLEAERAEQVADFLTGLFEDADPAATGGEAVSARDVLDVGARRIDRELSDRPELQSSLFGVIGEVYQNIGAYDASRTHLERSLELARETPSMEDGEIADYMRVLARLYQETGQYDDADRLYREALGLLTPTSASARLRIARTHHAYGTLHWEMRDMRAADSLYVLAQSTIEDELPQTHWLQSTLIEDRATIVFEEGRLEEAGTGYAEALRLRRAAHPGDHPNIALSLNNLAMVRRHQGRYATAESLYTASLDIRVRLFGERHPDVAHTLNHLGRLYYNMGDYDRAEPFARRAMALRADLYGEKHVSTISSMGSLAGTLAARGDAGEAIDILQQARDYLLEAVGPDHAYVGVYSGRIASLHHTQGHMEAAEPLFLESIRIYRLTSPRGDYRGSTVLVRYAEFLMDAGRPAEATPHLEEAIQVTANIHGADAWQVARIRSVLGQCLVDLGRYDAANTHLTESVEILTDAHGPDDPRTKEAKQRLDAFKRAHGTPAKAA